MTVVLVQGNPETEAHRPRDPAAAPSLDVACRHGQIPRAAAQQPTGGANHFG